MLSPQFCKMCDVWFVIVTNRAELDNGSYDYAIIKNWHCPCCDSQRGQCEASLELGCHFAYAPGIYLSSSEYVHWMLPKLRSGSTKMTPKLGEILFGFLEHLQED